MVSDNEKNKSQWVEDKVAREKDAYYIVDGQQRLTTSIILIQVLLESVQGEKWFAGEELEELRKQYIGGKTEDETKYYYFGYMENNANTLNVLRRRFFLAIILTQNRHTDSIYTRKSKNAKEFFEKKIAEATKEYKEELFKTLTQNFMFNVYEIANDFDVFVAFETMNNRGKPLSTPRAFKKSSHLSQHKNAKF